MLRWRGRFDRQGSERTWGRVGIGEASREAERDEKEVDGVGHAESDDVDEVKVQLD